MAYNLEQHPLRTEPKARSTFQNALVVHSQQCGLHSLTYQPRISVMHERHIAAITGPIENTKMTHSVRSSTVTVRLSQLGGPGSHEVEGIAGVRQ